MRTIEVCRNDESRISCSPGQVLTIQSANVQKSLIIPWCGFYDFRQCDTPESLNIVKNSCQNRQSCTLKSNDQLFGDECAVTSAYLEVTYSCVDEEKITFSTLQDRITSNTDTPETANFMMTQTATRRSNRRDSTTSIDIDTNTLELTMTKKDIEYSVTGTAAIENAVTMLRSEHIIGVAAIAFLAILLLVAIIIIYKKKLSKQQVVPEDKQNAIYEMDATYAVSKDDTAMNIENRTYSFAVDKTDLVDPCTSDGTLSMADQTGESITTNVMTENILYGTH